MLEAINSVISRFILFIADKAEIFFQNLSLVDYSVFQIIIDILLIAILFYWIILFVSGTRAVNIIFGFIILAVIFLISKALSLLAVGWLLERLFMVILIAIPIIFHPELRRALEKLGKTKFFLAQQAKEIDILKSEIIEACNIMASQKTGALIVLRREVSLKEYIDTGVQILGKVTKELLLSIFNPQSPLHDGAVIIDNGKIVAASCTLPHSFKEYDRKFGTRHKAAIALSEITDADVIVVSEQKGTVSFARNGDMEADIDSIKLDSFLSETFKKKKA